MSLKRGQVYLATHDGEGNSLSNVVRSFISFTWGGRKIEDFGFIATIDGDRLSRNLYSEFEDLTTDYDIVDGQIFWGSKYNPLELSFTLSTDGVKEATLQEFRNWFKAGVTRELILSESPNRAIQARVSAAPSFSLLPFEELESVKIGNNSYSVRTTLWKGDLSLSFIMEDPFWYNIQSSFSSADELNEEIVKIILEDGVPHFDMFSDFSSSENDVCFLAKDKIFKSNAIQDNDNISLIANQPQYIYYCGTGKGKPILQFTCTSTFDSNSNYINLPKNSYTMNTTSNEDSPYNIIRIERKELLDAPEVDEDSNGEILDIGELVTLSDEATNNDTETTDDSNNTEPSTDTNENNNTETNNEGTDSTNENEPTPQVIETDKRVKTFESVFKFTTPGILTAYNQVVKIIDEDYEAGDSIIEMRSAIRDTVSDFYVRSFAMGMCDLALKGEFTGICNEETSALVSGFETNFISNLKKMFLGKSGTTITAAYVFDSLTGQAVMTLPVYLLDLNFSSNNDSNEIPLASDPTVIKENVGDMARSSYLIIDSRTLPKDGEITKDECLEITSNCNLSNVKLTYNYMYL